MMIECRCCQLQHTYIHITYMHTSIYVYIPTPLAFRCIYCQLEYICIYITFMHTSIYAYISTPLAFRCMYCQLEHKYMHITYIHTSMYVYILTPHAFRYLYCQLPCMATTAHTPQRGNYTHTQNMQTYRHKFIDTEADPQLQEKAHTHSPNHRPSHPTNYPPTHLPNHPHMQCDKRGRRNLLYGLRGF